MVRDRLTQEERTIRAHYLVAADGYKSPIRRQLGIPMHGPGTLSYHISILFQADLRSALRGRRIALCFLENSQVQGMLGLSPDGDAGMLFSIYHPEKGDTPEDFTEEHCIKLVRTAVGIPDLSVKLLSVLPWELAAQIAECYQQKRIFLVGDAAHVMPPTGGLGANTGIQDAYNLTWKLAYVLKGIAGSELLSTYGAERRPIAQLTVGQACARYADRVSLQLPIDNIEPIIDYWAIIFGYRYHSTAVLSEAQDDKGLYEDPFHPSGHPGTRAPHIVLERDSERMSILDLFGGDFVLLIGPEGMSWREAARRVAEKLGVDLEIYMIDEDLMDVDHRWHVSYTVTPTGAVLVRPDGFIGWRAKEANEHPEQTFELAFSTLLSRGIAMHTY